MIYQSSAGLYPVGGEGEGEAFTPISPASTRLKKIPTVVQITIEKALLECQKSILRKWSGIASNIIT